MTSERHKITTVGQVLNIEEVRQRFDGKLDRSGGPDACWLWQGRPNHCGYGTFSMSHGGGRTSTYLAHRVAFMLHHGSMPPAPLVVRHTCIGNRACCNPVHLVAGTQAENMEDRHRQGRTASKSGERNPRAKVSTGVVLQLRWTAACRGDYHQLARELGLSPSAANYIISGKRWGSVPMPGAAGWVGALTGHQLGHLALLKRAG